jgi:cathepsin F
MITGMTQLNQVQVILGAMVSCPIMPEYTLKVGLMWEKDNPYTDTDHGNCKFDNIGASVANFSIVSLYEDQIAANHVKNSLLAVAINAMLMHIYMNAHTCT